MTSVTGRSYDRRELLETILRKLEALYNQLQNGGASAIQKRYIATMYLLDKKSVYALPNGEQFEATIRGVLPTGHLRLEHGDGVVRDYAFKEVEFVLPHKR
jgi:BirA family biotin operon repressor/biotin-[acetyl-CoA-carboxylase] ligase